MIKAPCKKWDTMERQISEKNSYNLTALDSLRDLHNWYPVIETHKVVLKRRFIELACVSQFLVISLAKKGAVGWALGQLTLPHILEFYLPSFPHLL